MRITRACVIGILAAIIGSSVFAEAPDGCSEAKITVSVYNLARVPRGTLAHSERLATEIFKSAGITTEWTTVPVWDGTDLLTDFSASPANGCTEPLHSDTVRVQILPYAPPGFSIQALGYSLPCAERGIQVTIYADRVEAVSQHSLAAFYRVLGHALAHEVGHVLLRSSVHESDGIMKGVWSRNDWQRAAVTTVRFSPDEAKRMLQGLRETNSPGIVVALQRAPR